MILLNKHSGQEKLTLYEHIFSKQIVKIHNVTIPERQVIRIFFPQIMFVYASYKFCLSIFENTTSDYLTFLMYFEWFLPSSSQPIDSHNYTLLNLLHFFSFTMERFADFC